MSGKGNRYFNKYDPEVPPPEKRKCKKCAKDKPLEDFVNRPHCRYGKGGTCKECFNSGIDQKKAAERVRQWRKKNPKKYKEYSKNHYQKSVATEEQKEIKRAEARRIYWANPEKARNRNKKAQERYRRRLGKKPRVVKNFEDGRICPGCDTKKPWSDFLRCTRLAYLSGKKVSGYCITCRRLKNSEMWKRVKNDPHHIAMRNAQYAKYVSKHARHKANRNNHHYHKNKAEILRRDKVRRDNLEDSYIRQILRNEGHITIPKTLIFVRRVEVKKYRVLKQYRKVHNA
jgi:hypothetical protein